VFKPGGCCSTQPSSTRDQITGAVIPPPSTSALAKPRLIYSATTKGKSWKPFAAESRSELASKTSATWPYPEEQKEDGAEAS